MTASMHLKSGMARMLFMARASDFFLQRRTREGRFFVLAYHRVLPPEEAKAWVQPGMYVSPRTFECHLRFLRERCRVVPLYELLDPWIRASLRKEGKPACAVTFDDGWHDSYRHAFPLLKRYAIPATLFVPVNFIGSSRWFWTDRLARLLLACHRENRAVFEPAILPDGDRWAPVFQALDGRFEDQLERVIERLKAFRSEDAGRLVDALGRFHGIDPSPPGRAFMNWQEAREMVHSGLVDIGSHSLSHRILTTLSREEVEEEVQRSRDELLDRKLAEAETLSFCYPNGDFTSDIAHAVQQAGYRAGVTTRAGWNDRDPDPFALKRLGMHEDVSRTDAMFAARVAGLI